MSIPPEAKTLHHILIKKSKKKILRMLQRTANLEHTYKNGDTVYHSILKNGKLTEEDIIEISQVFRDQGLNSNARNNKVKAPAHLAIERRMLTVADYFIRFRNLIRMPSNTLTIFFVEDENKKFWYQVSQNCDDLEIWNSEEMETQSAEFLRWLISKEIDFDRRNSEGKNSLDMAIWFNVQHISLVLLEHATISFNCQSAHLLLQRFLHKNSYARKSHGHKKSSKLWYSSYTSRYSSKIVKILLNKGATVNKKYWTENVELAIKEGEDIDIIRILLDRFPYDSDKSSLATSLLYQLMEYSCEDLADSKIHCYQKILHDLVASGADVKNEHKHWMSPVQAAVKARNIHAVVWLNEIGSDFNLLTKDGKNLIHLLVAEKESNNLQQVAVFNFLIGKGCLVNSQDANGLSPLHLAAKNDNVPLVKKLIENNAEINCRDKNRQTPLHYAVVMNKTTELVELLLENDAKVNATDKRGEKPLSFAIFSSQQSCKVNMLKVLWKHGAQISALNSIRNKIDLMCLGYRIEASVVRELLKYGVDTSAPYFCRCLFWYGNPSVTIIFEQHCLKLKVAELQCLEDYRSFSRDEDGYRRCCEECLKEIETLKVTYIVSFTSIYDFLHMDLNKRCIYINNKKLKNLVGSPVLEEQFPQYAVIILASYREAVARKSLLQQAKEAWLELTKIHLPDICVERIISDLENEDLVNMIGVD